MPDITVKTITTDTQSVRDMTVGDLVLMNVGETITISLTNGIGGTNIREGVMKKLFTELNKPGTKTVLANLFNNS